MSDKILVDTSVLIDIQKGSKEDVTLIEMHAEDVTVSRITSMELIHGSRNASEKRSNKAFTCLLEPIDIDEEISQMAYSLVDRYSLKNRIHIGDAIIAATAISKNMKLWTKDNVHFNEIKELNLFKN